MSLWIVCLLIFSPLVTSFGDIPDFDQLIEQSAACDMDAMDRCAQRLLVYGDKSRQFPKNAEEGMVYCSESWLAVQCIELYFLNCNENFMVGQLFSLTLQAVRQSLKKGCVESGMNEIISHNACFSATKPELDDLMVELVSNIARIERSGKESWIPANCCFMSQFNAQVKQVVSDAPCSPESGAYISTVVQNLQTDIFDILCADDLVFGSPKCNDVLSQLLPRQRNVLRPRSMFPLIIKMLEQFFQGK